MQATSQNSNLHSFADLEILLDFLPERIKSKITDPDNLIEIAIDLERPVELLYNNNETIILDNVIGTTSMIDTLFDNLNETGEDNRVGIDGTLHRISKLVNKRGEAVGATIRIGKPYVGNIQLIEDLIKEDLNMLVLGRPGTGKTSLLRELSRILSSDLKKRVVIVDTSNEIAGEGDVPHRAVGRARRIQVPYGKEQHCVMIEAVENHNPQCIIIDEVSTIQETEAAQTILQRGVRLIATAHGNTLEDLIFNTPINGLIGGIKSVTLSDAEAEKRNTSKTVKESACDSAFDCIVEIRAFDEVAIHKDVKKSVNAIINNRKSLPEIRRIVQGKVLVIQQASIEEAPERVALTPTTSTFQPIINNDSGNDSVIRSNN